MKMSNEENLGTPVNEEKPEGNPSAGNEEKELSPEELKAELKRVRQEAASRRIANRELEEQAKKWREYEESQKTELQKLQEALAERDQKLSSYELKEVKLGLIDEFGLDKDDLDLLTGSDEASNRVIAEKLKAKMEKLGSANASRPADLLAGNRGNPVGSTNDTNSFDDMLRRMAQGR
jgi:hypothetical protein